MNVTPASIPSSPLQKAQENIANILRLAFEHGDKNDAVVVWDSNSELARMLVQAYRHCLPQALFVDFDASEPSKIQATFESLKPNDLVVLVQSTNFRLHSFRIRMELFKRSLKVIEHPHLGRMPAEQSAIYIDALAYDLDYYRGTGKALKRLIDATEQATVTSAGESLVFSAGLEPAKLNVGDYRELNNTGGQFPIGEVFTESKDLEAVNGRLRIAFFGDTSFRVNQPPTPIGLSIEAGRVVQTCDSTPAFEQVLSEIRNHEGQVWLRELGFGMNRALSPTRTVSDIGTFERMCGVHLSLGAKHASYNKPNIRKKAARFHVDVFAALDAVHLDDLSIFHNGAWVLPL